MKALYEEYLLNKREISALQFRQDKILADLFIINENKIAKKEGDGSVSFQDGDYKITFVKRSTVTVDQTKAKDYPHLFKTKYEYSKTILKSLNDQEKSVINDCITVKPAKPSLNIEVNYEN